MRSSLLEISGSVPIAWTTRRRSTCGSRSVLRTSMAASREVGKLTAPDRSRAMSSRIRKWMLPDAMSAADVAFQLLNQEFLVADGFLDQVADRDHAGDVAILFKNRQVAKALFGHQGHALVQGRGERNVGDAVAHDFADQGFLRALAVQDDLAGVIAFGK